MPWEIRRGLGGPHTLSLLRGIVACHRSTPASKTAEEGTILKLRKKRESLELGLEVTCW